MRVRVLLFGQLRDTVGASEEIVELADGQCAADLLAHYRQRFPRLQEVCPRLAMAVNQEYAESSIVLREGDEVALLPPVSGGANAPGSLVRLTREPIDPVALLAGLASPNDGALATFDGIVRRWTGRRETVRIEYEAYEPMALAKMEEIAAEVGKRFEVNHVVLVHRLGMVEAGESSVFVAVHAPHRDASFQACRFAIDTLKQKVPIWKKEFLSTGAVWADGELPARGIETGPAKVER